MTGEAGLMSASPQNCLGVGLAFPRTTSDVISLVMVPGNAGGPEDLPIQWLSMSGGLPK